MDHRETLIAYALMYQGDWTKIAQAAAERRIPKPCASKDPCITIYDPEYPEELKQLRYPPWVLFYRGNPALLKQPKASIVGSRDLSFSGQRATKDAARCLCDRFVLVSGLAKGADSIAHRIGLTGKGTIGIIGSGLGTCYPAENRELYETMFRKGLVLSEYPHDTGIARFHFPWRNRLIAALGEFTVVTQAKIQSGTMHTVNEAEVLGRDVYSFPYVYDDPYGKGCNQLIMDGAIPVYDLSLLKQMRPLHHV